MPGVCARCHREVYFAEERLALGKVWHAFCFSCLNCRKLLDSCTVSTYRGELYCRNCYSRLFSTILRSSRETNASKEIETFPRVTSVPTTISVNECNWSRCRCCCRYCRCCSVENHPIGKDGSSIDEKNYRLKKHRLRGGGQEEHSRSSTEGIEEKPTNITPKPRPCPRSSVRRVSFREERNTLDRCRDSRMQNARKEFSADRTTNRSIDNGSHTDILTIPSSDEDVRRFDQDTREEGSVNYNKSVIRRDDRVLSERDEDNIVDKDMTNYNRRKLEDSKNVEVRDNGNDGSGDGSCNDGSGNDDDEDNDEDDNCEEDGRMRGGHGGNNFCRPRKSEGCCANEPSNETCGCYSCQNADDNVCGYREVETRKRYSDSCPPRELDPCRNDREAASCSSTARSPVCADRHGRCPPAGCRPICKKVGRSCCSPCRGESLSCGGGGCCGSGCRGGCGRPGQICMPARPCTTPPCRPCPPYLGSSCASPRTCPPSSSCCRPASRGGCPTCCRSSGPSCRAAHIGSCRFDEGPCYDTDEDFSCKSKVPPGCECLGGGLDCQRCGRKVYQAEMQVVSGVPYHSICFSCFCCRKPLEPLTYQENCGEIYCKQCYIRNFGPQGYGYGVGAGALQTPM